MDNVIQPLNNWPLGYRDCSSSIFVAVKSIRSESLDVYMLEDLHTRLWFHVVMISRMSRWNDGISTEIILHSIDQYRQVNSGWHLTSYQLLVKSRPRPLQASPNHILTRNQVRVHPPLPAGFSPASPASFSLNLKNPPQCPHKFNQSLHLPYALDDVHVLWMSKSIFSPESNLKPFLKLEKNTFNERIFLLVSSGQELQSIYYVWLY